MRTCAGPVAARPPATATSIAAVKTSAAAKTALVVVNEFLISSREGHPDEALDPASLFHKRGREPSRGLHFLFPRACRTALTALAIDAGIRRRPWRTVSRTAAAAS